MKIQGLARTQTHGLADYDAANLHAQYRFDRLFTTIVNCLCLDRCSLLVVAVRLCSMDELGGYPLPNCCFNSVAHTRTSTARGSCIVAGGRHRLHGPRPDYPGPDCRNLDLLGS